MSDPIIPTPENPIPDVDDIKPRIPFPAWSDEGGGGGGGDSPVGLAKVTLLPDSSDLVVGDVFDSQYVAIYFPENGAYPPFVNAISLIDQSIPFNNWNSRMERGDRIVALQSFIMKDTYEYSIEGDAEIKEDEEVKYIYVTGDCTIMVSLEESQE